MQILLFPKSNRERHVNGYRKRYTLISVQEKKNVEEYTAPKHVRIKL